MTNAADRHGFDLIFLSKRKRREHGDPAVIGLHTRKSNQRKSVQSALIRVPIETLVKRTDREKIAQELCVNDRPAGERSNR
ncbi:MAG: hypothetical protein DWQ29_12560 [Planctomycetota bacterium]|nr:MAG: hypothetical protein DWQ29_12560 [Planctomycetota bacterium]